MWIKAAVLRSADGPFLIEDVELRDPAPDEVRLRISGTGLCHTDLLPRHPGFAAVSPIVLGHEASGVVDAVGEAVTNVVVGDHVVASFDSCRQCATCTSGHPAYCDGFVVRNLTGVGIEHSDSVLDIDGNTIASRWFGQSSFASHAIVADRNIVKVDPSLPLELLGPLGCGMLTGAGSIFGALGVTRGSSVVVFGAGSVGLSAVMAARVVGAAVIVAVDVHPARLQWARELGATHVVPGAADDLSEQLAEATGGGADYALDTTGIPAVVQVAIRSLKRTGTCGLVGAQQGPLMLEPTDLAFGRTVKGILVGDAVPEVVIPHLIELWQQGCFPFDRLVTRYRLDQINEAESASLRGEVVKAVLVP